MERRAIGALFLYPKRGETHGTIHPLHRRTEAPGRSGRSGILPARPGRKADRLRTGEASRKRPQHHRPGQRMVRSCRRKRRRPRILLADPLRSQLSGCHDDAPGWGCRPDKDHLRGKETSTAQNLHSPGSQQQYAQGLCLSPEGAQAGSGGGRTLCQRGHDL